jgi:hypothetical protein
MADTDDYKPILTNTSYCIPVPRKGFLRMEIRADGGNDSLFAALMKMPKVVEVEYNGHFGANIFVKMEGEHVTNGCVSDDLQAVIAEIKKHIQNRKRVCR